MVGVKSKTYVATSASANIETQLEVGARLLGVYCSAPALADDAILRILLGTTPVWQTRVDGSTSTNMANVQWFGMPGPNGGRNLLNIAGADVDTTQGAWPANMPANIIDSVAGNLSVNIEITIENGGVVTVFYTVDTPIDSEPW